MKDSIWLTLSQEDYHIAHNQTYAIDRFLPEDALAVVRHFYGVYGDAYSAAIFYDLKNSPKVKGRKRRML